MSGNKEGGHKGEKGTGVVHNLPFSNQTLGKCNNQALCQTSTSKPTRPAEMSLPAELGPAREERKR